MWPFSEVSRDTFEKRKDFVEEVMENIMEDANSFPHDLSDEEIAKEVRCLLGIEV